MTETIQRNTSHDVVVLAEAIEVNQRTLLGIAEEVAVVEEAPEVAQVCTIRTRKGAEVIETPVECTN